RACADDRADYHRITGPGGTTEAYLRRSLRRSGLGIRKRSVSAAARSGLVVAGQAGCEEVELLHMKFEWNTNKAKRNFRKHGVSFNEAATVLTIHWPHTTRIPIIQLVSAVI